MNPQAKGERQKKWNTHSGRGGEDLAHNNIYIYIYTRAIHYVRTCYITNTIYKRENKKKWLNGGKYREIYVASLDYTYFTHTHMDTYTERHVRILCARSRQENHRGVHKKRERREGEKQKGLNRARA